MLQWVRGDRMSKLELINEYLEKNKSTYVGKYRCHSSVQTKPNEHKFQYYIYDSQFREISVFLTIAFGNDEIIPTFSLSLNQREQQYMIQDALEKIATLSSYQSMLHTDIFEHFIRNSESISMLAPIDYRNILDYLEFHKGTNDKTISEFYDIYIPYIRRLIETKSYRKLIDSLALILDKISYEYEWDGSTSKYLDTEYQYHLKFFTNILIECLPLLDHFDKDETLEFYEIFFNVMQVRRFALLILVKIDINFVRSLPLVADLIDYLVERTHNENNHNFVIDYLKSVYYQDEDLLRVTTIEVVRMIVHDYLSFANHELILEIGNAIIEIQGYDFIIDYFSVDYNTFVFAAFPISTFPEIYKQRIKRELEKAIRFYAARMEHPRYYLPSFEQVTNINRILMENFGGYNQ